MAFTIPSIFTAIDRLSRPVKQMASRVNSSMAAMEKKFKDVSEVSKKMMVGGAVVGTVIAAPLVMATKKAIDFEDQMADVAKTTGLSGELLKKLGDSILSYSGKTRTSIQELTQIAAIGGSMGIAANQLDAFTKSADKFNIALGSDFGGVETAVKSVAALRNLFKETRGLEAADSINKVGSAINALTMKGAGAQAMNDITQRLGALPDFLKPSIQDTIALAAVLDKAGISAEVAASGMTQLTSLGGREIAAFAKQMKLSTAAATKLLNTDPSKFAFKLAESFRGMDGVKAIQTMDAMKIKSTEVMKMIGALGANYDDFIKYQQISNNEFVNANSLSQEAAAKNATHAAKIEMLKNQVETLAIKAGELLLPILDELLNTITPIIDSTSKWISENKETAKIIAYVAGGVAGFAFALSGIAGVIQSIITITKAWRAVQAALNITLSANPIGIIILSIVTLIGIIIWLKDNVTGWGEQWDQVWGFAKAVFLHQANIIKLGFLTLADKFMSMVEIIKWAWLTLQNKIGAMSDDRYQNELRLIEQEKNARLKAYKETEAEVLKHQDRISQGIEWKLKMKAPADSTTTAAATPAINPKAEQNKALASTMTETINNKLSIDINGNPKDFSYKAPAGIPVRLTPNIG